MEMSHQKAPSAQSQLPCSWTEQVVILKGQPANSGHLYTLIYLAVILEWEVNW